MRATLTRDGNEVGVFTMTRDGDYSSDCSDDERERFNVVIEKIIEDLRKPATFVGHSDPARGIYDPEPVIYKPGEPRWFNEVLTRLRNKGYEHEDVGLDAG